MMKPPLIGVSENIKKVRDIIKQVAHTGLNIVITGETGVGKEIVARRLYHASPRFKKPFVKINCAALPEGLLESELFGYEAGAFTGAEKRRRGKFELSNTGVLFLDEIGDMPIALQSKLLHVLQSGEFSPLGAERDIKSDAWVVAATNRILEEDVKEGKFREDLYYRLNIINIHLAPLRERREDILCLVDYYAKRYRQEFGDGNLPRLSTAAMDKLRNYSWPGNVRELQNVLKNVTVTKSWQIVNTLSEGKHFINDNITAPVVTAEILDLVEVKTENLRGMNSVPLKKIKKNVISRIEREIIENILSRTYWNRSKASKILKISYKTLLEKIDELKIKPPADL